MNRSKLFKTITSLAFAGALIFVHGPATALAMAQATKATVLGTVRDEKGSTVANARVSVKSVDTGITREVTADEDGRFRVPELSPGRYEIRAEHDGFAAEVRSGIELTVGQEAVIDFGLKVGSVQESAVIKGDAPLVDTTSATVGYLINGAQIEELPLNGRDVMQLAALNSGAITTTGAAAGQAEVGPGRTLLSFNGGRLDFNAFYLDGTETVDGFGYTPGGLGGGFLGVDALQEFQVLTTNYSAEYGQGGGAIINAVTKSGTNQFHGTAFEFLRNSALDARNFFNSNKLDFSRNQFGGSVGGPIIKNKTFFFVNYEGLRQSEGDTGVFTVPSPQARLGNLSTGQITIPATVAPYLALYPQGNGQIQGDVQDYSRDFTSPTGEDFFVTRIDHTINDKHSVFGRYTFDNSNLTQISGVITDEALANRDQYVTIGEQWVISPRALNSIRFGYSRSNFASNIAFDEPVSSSLGFIPGHEMGAFDLQGVSPLRGPLEAQEHYLLNTPEISDQFIYTRGAHSLKIGGLIRRYQLNADSPLIPDGLFIYFGGLSSFLQGTPAIEYASPPGTDFYRGIRQSLFGAYIQDDWKVRSNLTINIGLRYDPISTPTAVRDEYSNLRTYTAPTVTVGAPFIQNPSLHNFAPRFGISWDPTGSGKTSIRAGIGTFYSAILPMRYRFSISSGPPFANLLLFPAVFPNGYETGIQNPIPAPGLLWPMQYNAEQPTIYQWNLSIQHQIGSSLLLTAGYIGSRGVHLETENENNININYRIVNGQIFYPPGAPSISYNPNFGAITDLEFNGDSHYNALQVSATKRYSYGLQFLASYTFASALDDATESDTVFSSSFGSSAQNPLNQAGDYGRSDVYARNSFVASALWDLPFGRGHALGGDATGAGQKLIEGWQLGGILNLRSGFPFTVGLGFDQVGNGTNNVQSERPNMAPGYTYASAVTGNPNQYLNPAAFALQPAGFYGDESRNAFIGPNLKDLDFSVVKRTSISERLKTEFRFEAFNLFNRVNFANPPSTNLAVFTGANPNGSGSVAGNFAQLTSTATSSRQLQFGFKFIF
jgi:hypothetical protein